MEKREKIIVTTVAIAVVVMLFYMVLEQDKKGPASETDSENMIKTDQFIEDQVKIISQFGKRDVAEMMIKKAAVSWSKDPFASPDLIKEIEGITEKKKTTVSRKKESIPLLYSGYVKAGKKLLAIINAMEYEKGDTIEGTGYKILSISAKNVMLRSRDSVVISVPLVDGYGEYDMGTKN